MRSSVFLTAVMCLGAAASGPLKSQPDDAAGEARAVILSSKVIGEGECVQAIPEPGSKTVTFTVPPEDRDYYTYRIARFDAGGYGFTSAMPDQYGIIHGEVGSQRIVDLVAACDGQARQNTREEEQEHYYLVAKENSTGQQYYTLDLPQVRLTALLASLGGSISPSLRSLGDNRTAWMRRRLDTRQENRHMAQNIFLSIQGDMLSLAQVLDAIYVKTGCVAHENDGFIVIASC